MYSVVTLTENLSQLLLVFNLTHCGHGKVHVLCLGIVKQAFLVVPAGGLHILRHTVWVNPKHRGVAAVIINACMVFTVTISEEAVSCLCSPCTLEYQDQYLVYSKVSSCKELLYLASRCMD